MGKKKKKGKTRPEAGYKWKRRGDKGSYRCSFCGRRVSRTKVRVIRKRGLKFYLCLRCAKKRGITGKPW